MNIDKNQLQQEQYGRIRLGDIAEEGLGSSFWAEIVKPILDSMIKGVTDITTINLTSEKKASIELAGRKLAAQYLQEIETLIKGYIIDANTTKASMIKKEVPLYKTVEDTE